MLAPMFDNGIKRIRPSNSGNQQYNHQFDDGQSILYFHVGFLCRFCWTDQPCG